LLILVIIYDFYSGIIFFSILEIIEDFPFLEITTPKGEMLFSFLTKRPNPKQNWKRTNFLKPEIIFPKKIKQNQTSEIVFIKTRHRFCLKSTLLGFLLP
jgi:hypothetical protein